MWPYLTCWTGKLTRGRSATWTSSHRTSWIDTTSWQELFSCRTPSTYCTRATRSACLTWKDHCLKVSTWWPITHPRRRKESRWQHRPGLIISSWVKWSTLDAQALASLIQHSQLKQQLATWQSTIDLKAFYWCNLTSQQWMARFLESMSTHGSTLLPTSSQEPSSSRSSVSDQLKGCVVTDAKERLSSLTFN